MARKGHRARRLIEREVQLGEGDPIGAFVNWRLPKRTVTWGQVKKALEGADLPLELYAPPRKRKPYTRNEIMRLLTRNLYDYLGAISLVEKGGAYFVPAPYLPEVRQHQRFVEALYSKEADIGIGFFMTAVHLPGDLPQLVGIELWDTVDLLTTEADGFGEAAPRSDTLKRRVLELTAMKRKCELFDQVFGYDFTAELKKTITDLELTIEAMSEKAAA